MVSNVILMSFDAGDCSVLVLLDYCFAFSTVDHHILIKRLEDWVGISGIALDYFLLYLTDRSFTQFQFRLYWRLCVRLFSRTTRSGSPVIRAKHIAMGKGPIVIAMFIFIIIIRAISQRRLFRGDI